MKYVVIGSSHAGYEAIQTLIKEKPNSEIHLFERGDKPSFLSCGIQSYLEDISPSLDSLHYATTESYKQQNVHVHTESDVVNLDTENKIITVNKNGQTYKFSYDKLFLSPGGQPVTPPVEGINDVNHVYFMRGREWADKIKKRMLSANKVIVVGGGYIGIEAAEAFTKAGIDTKIIDISERILSTYLDKEFTDILESNAQDYGLTCRGNETVKALKSDSVGNVNKVVTDKGEYEADTVIFAVGVTPSTKWLEGKIKLGAKGIIEIDNYLQTSAKDVYAGGDATMIPYAPIDEQRYIALATNSRRQGVIAAKNMTGQSIQMPKVSGTSGLALFDYKFGQTGVHNFESENYDGNLGSKYVEEMIRPKFMQDEAKVHMKIIYDEDTHRILGGQIMSKEDLVESINTLSIAINAGFTLEQLAFVDFFFQPDFDRPWNYLNVLAQQALNETFGSDKMLF